MRADALKDQALDLWMTRTRFAQALDLWMTRTRFAQALDVCMTRTRFAQALDVCMTRAVQLRRTILQATLMHAAQCG